MFLACCFAFFVFIFYLICSKSSVDKNHAEKKRAKEDGVDSKKNKKTSQSVSIPSFTNSALLGTQRKTRKPEQNTIKTRTPTSKYITLR